MNPVYIGVAWPYANGSLHLGHIAGSLLPPDIFRRYSKMQGHKVLMVSGSDCHGTPILLKAEAEGKTPAEVVAHYHHDHSRALKALQIDFDLFTTTTTDNHRDTVQEVFNAALEGGYIERRTQPAPYDAKDGRFLPDRYVEGTCPHCEFADARGDQCDNCGKTLDPQELLNPRSKLNPDQPIEFRDTEHFFFLLSKLQPQLESYVAKTAGHWRANTINFTQNWLNEGLQDRAITRDLTWGIPIPMEGYDDKRIYVWFEAVCGYLSASKEWAKASGNPDAWTEWWLNPETKSYYFLGKDNIPFHTIIWPAILTAANEARANNGEPALQLPFDVPANEFLNLSGKQFSKSRGIGIGVHDVLERFPSDSVRYYLATNMPEQRDADWTWEDFLAKVNDELVGTIGNLVHRILSFTQKNLGEIPTQSNNDDLAKSVNDAIAACGDEMSIHLDAVQLKKAIKRLLEFAGTGNQLMQEAAPWKRLKSDPEGAAGDLHALLRIVKALAVYMAPYLPDASDRIWKMLNETGSVHDANWSDAKAPLAGGSLAPPTALFVKLDPKDLPQAVESLDATKGQAAKQPDGKKTKTHEKPETVAFDDFANIDLRIAIIKSVEDHPKADKLYVIKLDAGELGERQIVAGLKAYYSPEELTGQTVAFVANLAPVTLRGVESQGMILAGDKGDVVSVLNPNKALPPGSTIR